MRYVNNGNILYRDFQSEVDAMIDAIESVYPYPENEDDVDNTPENTEKLFDLLLEVHKLIVTNW